ncbi:MAG: protocatechuate 3,4-dioxygenase [Pseudomonadota bacterium]
MIKRRTFAAHLSTCSAAIALAPAAALSALSTPGQVEGPFYPVDTRGERDVDLTQLEGHAEAAKGESIIVRGTVLGRRGEALPGAVVDIWQANQHGRYNHPRDPNPAPLDPDFQGWGIMKTSRQGEYGFKTIKPGAYPLAPLGGRGWRCRHIHFKVSCPGYQPLTTQMYFEGDPLIDQDQVLARAPAAARHLLIAAAEQGEVSGLPEYRFDITLAQST